MTAEKVVIMGRIWLAIILTLAGAGALAAQTSYPMITHCSPAAVQSGQTTEVIIEGQQNFAGASAVLFDSPGLVGEIVPPPAAAAGKPPAPGPVRSVRVRITVPAEAPLGVREVRLLTERGLSSVGQLLVVADPVVAHEPTNTTADKAVSIPVPGVACGRLAAPEQTYFYKVELKAGQWLTASVASARLQDKIHDLQKHADPLLALFDPQGREIAAADDEVYADPRLSVRVQTNGVYVVRLRDAKFDGDPRWTYALSLVAMPGVDQVLPCAGRPGEKLKVAVAMGGAVAEGEVQLPAESGPGPRRLPVHLADGRWVEGTFLLTDLPPAPAVASGPKPRVAPIPSYVCGSLAQPRAEEVFEFTAKRGQLLRIEVWARRFGTPLASALDGVLEVRDAKGAVLARADDLAPSIKDPGLDFRVPADGVYQVRLRDLHRRGGPGFTYTLALSHARPDFVLRCDGDKANLSPGVSVPWFVQVDRLRGFNAAIEVRVEGLPPGVTASPCILGPGLNQGVVVLTAAADAALGAAPVRVFGQSVQPDEEGNPRPIARPASVLQEIYLPGGGRGRFEVSLQAVAVVRASDIVRVVPQVERITLRPGEEVAIPVKLERRPEAKDANVTLDVRLRHLGQMFVDPLPPGVTLVEAKSKLLVGKGNEGLIVLRAAPNAAAVQDVPIAVAAHVSVNFMVKVAYCSPPVPLSVTPAGASTPR